MKPHILVVDDDDRLRGLLHRFLTEQGFAVSTAADATEAREMLKLFLFDLMVLDVMMPGENGLSLAASLAEKPPTLMLSALSEAEDRIRGLEAGVDDYLAKPFDPTELKLRIEAILRRSAPAVAFTFGEYRFDSARRQLMRAEEPVALTSAEAAMLAALAAHLNRPVSRERLAELTGQSAGRSVDVQMTRLRKKLDGAYIQTVRGAGYMLRGASS